MSTIALVTLPLPGHMRPMMAAARALKQAGHTPIVVGPPDLTSRIPDDVAVRTVGADRFPSGTLDARCACLSRMTSLSDMRQMFNTIAALSQFYIDHLPDAIDAIGADAVLHDQLEPGAGIVARGLSQSWGIRHISLACALPMNREPSIPPPFLGWRYRPGAFGDWLNAGYYRVVNALHAEQSRVLADGAQRFGLTKPDGLEDWQRVWSVDDGISRQKDLVQGLASLDYPRQTPPTYLGPLRDAETRYPGLDSIAAERDGRPLAFISLGTLMGGRTRLLRAMAKAAKARGLQPVVVHGGRMEEGEAASFPKGTIIRDFLDQRQIMDDADAALLHGGHNSTTDAVSAGLPLIILPQAFEQGAMAARVERAGLGRAVGRMGPSLSQRIELALGDVMQSQTMRKAMRRARYEAMASPGLAGLVSHVDAALSGSAQTAEKLPQLTTETARYAPFPDMVPAE